jgi:hypothetical protein
MRSLRQSSVRERYERGSRIRVSQGAAGVSSAFSLIVIEETLPDSKSFLKHILKRYE